MKYQILTASSAEKVTDEVNQLLKSGWELFGELHVNAYYAHYGEDEYEHVLTFSQAMIKREETDKQGETSLPLFEKSYGKDS
jgi:hypothetical protein